MFENLKNASEIFSKMGEMRGKMEEIKKRISNLRVMGDAGAGMVQVTSTGDGAIVDVKINRALFDSEDNKMLEDLVMAATNDAIQKAKQAAEYELKSITGGLDLSEISKLFGGNLG
ncbi:YbaB/EbfC family nucleoid-associated protein [Leptospira venezuelensis]|uniref:Nucleoid-associated protein EHQ81_05885 n=4 Tax=Leptospira TaxID=171 RepID=A0A4V3JDA0_9LEPT|nr:MULTISPECIES: YbaB/EbfC family nucleoid-associated protein [Leptospira]PJZ50576.1 YbaB/EbfC family nucleoid-associated protein [Leptospira saintgironsiae]TGK09189.1 YbaB/EbfC family nucleoid-associated protein [Leptospira selangorensis]TGL34404.1 YbaB/EbfC family nucleoid-associated protein [Leptospira koniambonensis]TGM15919.1 YbaB/EbfC family nucleoid-associated protein [Leptospira selangorensis]TGM18131.1 YbaB/EbfC family nucleoid-associated protein [Leptospira selangorensis]